MHTDETDLFLIAVNRVKPGLHAFLFILSWAFILNVSTLHSQTKSVVSQEKSDNITITGKVKDATGEVLPGVSITVKGLQIGTVTSHDGTFILKVPFQTSRLVFSFIGMEQQEVSITGSTFLNITMVDQTVKMTEVVVVGYGQQSKATYTGAISSVGTKGLVQSAQANISNALVGRVSGLTAVQKSGEPGKDQSTIRIRGTGTFTGSQDPLIMVDGIETANYNSIDPNEIENVSILKDASATAVYGVRGANGVILITTRRGVVSKPKVSISTNFASTSFANLRKQMDSYSWAKSFNEAQYYDGYLTGNYTPRYSEEEIEKYRTGSDPVFYSNTDWIKLLFSDRSSQSQQNISINGGTEKVKYFVSIGHFSQEGMFNNTNLMAGYNTQVSYERYNYRSNFDFQVSNNFSVTLNVSNQLEERKGPSDPTNYVLANAFAHPPTSGPGIIDGKLINNLVGQYNFIQNPIIGLVIGHGQLQRYSNQLNASTRFNYKLDDLLKGLSTHLTISYQNYNEHTLRYVKNMLTYNVVRADDGVSAVYIPQGTESPFSVNENYWKNRKEYLEAGFDYFHKFGNHSVGGLLLYNQSKYYDPSLAFLIPNSYQGVVGRVTYDYNNKYLAEINVGYNGTENFAPGKRFGLFPALSLGWVVSEESFFGENNIISFLKLRGSYGEVGNDKIGGARFLYLPTAYLYSDESGNFNDNVAYWFGTVGSNYTRYKTSSEGKIGNPDLTWERAKKMNIGVDVTLWSDKIRITADLFSETRNNIPFLLDVDRCSCLYNSGQEAF